MTLSITHFMRDRRPHAYSIERLYEDIRSELPPDCGVTEWVCRNPSKGFWGRLRDAWAARRAQGDVNHVTGDTHYLAFFLDRDRTVLTIHDLVTIERSQGFRRWVFWFFWFWLPVARSRVVITVSESTRDSLIRSVFCSSSKIVVIPNPVSKEFYPVPKRFNDSSPRILQIGTKPNKNLCRVAAALAEIECRLVIIGPLSAEDEGLLARYGVDYESHVGLSREALREQYVLSDMLIFASTYEGFGLPIVEANSVGRPVVTSNLSPMKDVAHAAACLVDPFNVDSIREGVRKVIGDPLYREQLIASGLTNAVRFHRTSIAEQYAAVYRRVAR